MAAVEVEESDVLEVKDTCAGNVRETALPDETRETLAHGKGNNLGHLVEALILLPHMV